MTPSPLVVLTVGTDTHPFDRAVRWVDQWAAANPDVRVVVQWGTSAPPSTAEGGDLLPRPDLDELLAAADAVVSHGGPATLQQIRSVGLLPLCLPRDPALGEHIDDHQQRFARHQAAHGRVRLVTGRDDLHRVLDAVVADPDHLDFDPACDDSVAAAATRRLGGFVAALLDDDTTEIERLHRDALHTRTDQDLL